MSEKLVTSELLILEENSYYLFMKSLLGWCRSIVEMTSSKHPDQNITQIGERLAHTHHNHMCSVINEGWCVNVFQQVNLIEYEYINKEKLGVPARFNWMKLVFQRIEKMFVSKLK